MMKKMLITGFALTAMSASAVADVKWGGWVDGQYNNGMVLAGVVGDTFGMNSSAIEANAEMGKSSVHVRLGVTGRRAVTNLAFDNRTAVHFDHDFGVFRWRIGQFDSLFGFEQNDQRKNTFNNQGLLYINATPLVHVGTAFFFELAKNMEIALLAANFQDTGTRQIGNAHQYGAKFNLMGDFRLGAGVLITPQTAGTRTSLHFNLGVDLGSLAIDAEFDSISFAGGANGTGIQGNVVNKFGDDWALGARVEITNTLANGNSALQITAGPQFFLTKALTAKIDYTLNETELVAGAAKTTNHGVAVGGVYAF